MDWYIDTGVQELIAPMKREESDGLQLPENWMQFEMNENLWSPETYFINKSSSNDLDHHHFSSSSVSCGDSLQLDDLDGMDYLSYLLEDLPVTEESIGEDVLWKNKMKLGSQSIILSKNNICHGLSSSKYLKTHAFSPTLPMDHDSSSSSHFAQLINLGLKDCPSIKPPTGTVTVSPSERKTDEMSMEESVLLEFRAVMDQMTAETRLCFRDGLYRLARNSKGSDILHIDDRGVRSRKTEAQESETNIIDRTIASLMFNNHKPSSNNQKTSHFTSPVIISGDAEVPIFRSEI